jgi:hypothetical protein
MRTPAFGLLNRLAVLIARAASLALFLVWGSFFFEHLVWFEDPATWPPPRVWLTQGLHLTLLLGYLLSLFWERLGSVLIAVGSVAFFGLTGGVDALTFAFVSLLPVPFYALGWLSRPGSPRPEA